MPNRLIRDGLLESEAVLSLTIEARWLLITIMLSADDVGLFEATEFRLARRADLRREIVGKLLEMLADQDLVRLYEVGSKRYGFVPRFRQRVQIKKVRYPLPPEALLSGDVDALNKIKELSARTTVAQRLDRADTPDVQPSEAEAEAEFLVSPSRTSSSKARRQKATVPPCPIQKLIEIYHAVLPMLPAVDVLQPRRKQLIAKAWNWVMTSRRRDGTRRATTLAEGLAWFQKYFSRAAENDFITGRTRPGPGHEGWRASIDYLLTEKGIVQVIERTQGPS